jgi:hypothetical protein
LGSALWRLSPIAAEAVRMDLAVHQWIVLVVWVAVMGWSEGYRGFQQMFSPRVVARAIALARDPQPLRVVFAPVFCMGLFGATRKRKIVARSLTAGIVGLVLLVRMLAQPWRGIIDAGVVFGLAWGAVAIVVFAVAALGGRPPSIDPDLPVPERPT